MSGGCPARRRECERKQESIRQKQPQAEAPAAEGRERAAGATKLPNARRAADQAAHDSVQEGEADAIQVP
eukprot:2185073-Pyramimonas_sp.AAC.1